MENSQNKESVMENQLQKKPNVIVVVLLKIWLPVLYSLGIIMMILLYSRWEVLDLPTKLIYLIAILIPFHVLEEWQIPGGFHINYNLFRKSTKIDRYPMCRATDSFTNFVATLIFIAIAFFGYSTSILIAFTLFCFMEMVAHTMFGIQMLNKFRSAGKMTIYNPGLLTMMVGFIPLFVGFTYCLTNLETITMLDWVYGLLELAAFAVLIILLPEKLWSDENTPYPFEGRYKKGYYAKFFHSDYK